MKDNCKKLLYLGLDPTRYLTKKELVHYPIITIAARPFTPFLQEQFQKVDGCEVILLTSRSSALLFFDYAKRAGIKDRQLFKKCYLAVGSATADLLPHAIRPAYECAEGIVSLLEKCPSLRNRTIFYPHSEEARPVICNYLREQQLSFIDLITYAPQIKEGQLPYDLEEFDEVVFTSPSTVDAFFSKKPLISKSLILTTIGPITDNALQKNIEKYEK